MAVTNDAYVAGFHSNSVQAIDPVALTASTIATGNDPEWVAITPDGTKAISVNTSGHSVSVIDTATNTLLATISLPSFSSPQFVVANNDFAYMATGGNNFLGIVDLTSLSYSMTLTNTVLFRPEGMVVSPDGAKLFCISDTSSLGSFSEFVYEIDLATNSLVSTTDLGASVSGRVISITPDGTTVFVTVQSSPFGVYYFSPGAATPSGPIAIGGESLHSLISADGKWLYCDDPFTPALYVIDVAAKTLSHTDAGYGTPVIIPNMPTFTYVSVGSLITVYDASGTATTSFTPPTQPEWGAVSPDKKTLYLLDPGAGSVYIYDTATNTLTGTVTGISGSALMLTAANAPVTPPPPSVVVPSLFIPRKGMDAYDQSDYMADWLAIERWGNSFAPPLFIPRKPGSHLPTIEDLNANWLVIEVWAQNVVQPLDAAFPSLFIPREDTAAAEDITVDFLAIQNWALGLYQQTH